MSVLDSIQSELATIDPGHGKRLVCTEEGQIVWARVLDATDDAVLGEWSFMVPGFDPAYFLAAVRANLT